MSSLNSAVRTKETEKFCQAKALCIHVDESTDIKSAKMLLVYLTSSSADGVSSTEHFGTILHLNTGLDAHSIAEKV